MSKITVSVSGDTSADLLASLVLLTAALGAKPAAAASTGTDTKAADAKAAADKKAKADADAKAKADKKAKADAAAKGKTGPDLNSLREQGRGCIKAGKNDEMKAALKELGADSITTLDPAKYADLADKLTAILNPAAADDGLGESDGL